MTEDNIQIPDCRNDVETGMYYLTGATIALSEEDIRFLLSSHNTSQYYALSPKHAKRFLLLLKSKIDEYEKKYGELKVKHPMLTPRKESKKLGFSFQNNFGQKLSNK